MTKPPKVTIREVAGRARVSLTTVSRVLNGRDLAHMRAETKARVLTAIEELDYTPVRAAQRLRKQTTQVIAVLLPDISNPFFSLLARGVESLAFENGYSTLICDSCHSLGKESRYLDILLQEGVDGVVFVPVGEPDRSKLERLTRQGIHVVVADRRVDGFPTVEATNAAGSFDLTNHLLALGYRRIAYLAGPREVSTAEDRLAGFRQAMSAAGLEPVTVRRGDFTYESGFMHTREILAGPPVDLVLAGNDLMAIGAIRAAAAAHLRVPEEIGVAGFDHVPWAALLVPELTSVRVPCYEMGQEAMSLLVHCLRDATGQASSKVLDTERVDGASTGRVKRGN